MVDYAADGCYVVAAAADEDVAADGGCYSLVCCHIQASYEDLHGAFYQLSVSLVAVVAGDVDYDDDVVGGGADVGGYDWCCLVER